MRMPGFNAGPDNPAVVQLQAADSPVPINALAALGPEAAASGTFHGFTGQTPAWPIDYLFRSLEWQVLDGDWRAASARGPPFEFGAYTGSVALTYRIAPSLL